jgi:hypothetical protein
MGMFWTVARAIAIGATIVTVAELSKSAPRYSALILSLPVVTISAFTISWSQHHELTVIATFARETLILVILGLPLFLPLIFCEQLGLGFWGSLSSGFVLASLAIGAWLFFAGRT